MQQFYLSWATEYATGDTEIDKNYQRILDAGMILYRYINFKDYPRDRVLEVARGINKVILRQMEIEISLLETYFPNDAQEHALEHLKYKQRFDLEERYGVSDHMRIIMSAKMIKEYMSEHFFEVDVPDLQRVKDKLNSFNRHEEAS